MQRAALALGLFVGLAWNVNAAVSLGIDELEKSNFAALAEVTDRDNDPLGDAEKVAT